MEKVNLCGQMGVPMKEIFRIIIFMDLGFINGQIKENMKEIG